jgi:hypothetical protein
MGSLIICALFIKYYYDDQSRKIRQVGQVEHREK